MADIKRSGAAALAFLAAFALIAPASLSGADSGKSGKEAKLYGYLIGSPPAGSGEVTAALNAKLKKDLNATMVLNYIDWNDLTAKYPLILAAQENIDWIFTANWQQYGQQAVRGAFLELSEETLRANMPRHYPAVGKIGWDQARIDGRIYMVPTSAPDKKVGAVLIRDDLRRKYGLGAIRNVKDLEPYLAAIKKNEPGMIPLNLDNGYDVGTLFDRLFTQFLRVPMSQLMPNTPFYWDFESARPTIQSQLSAANIEAFRKAAGMTKAWYDKGYINKNPFTNNVRSKESFALGKSGVAIGNTIDLQGTLQQCRDAGYEAAIVPALSVRGTYPADSYINNGFAIAAESRNPALTLRAMDLIMEEPSYGYLVYFGIEGKNYVITKDGKIGLPPGITADRNTYPPDASGFWFTNKDLFKPLASWSDQYLALQADMKKMLFNTPYSAFSFIPDKVKTELANTVQAMQQYASPIYVGMAGDPNEAIAVLRAKLAAAGTQRVIDEAQAQLTAFGERLK